MVTLTGTITYRARVALPPGAVIEVRLLDVSRADPSTSLRAGAPADALARAGIVTRGEQVPVAFSLSYDPDAIQPRRRYALQATIAVEGKIAWRTAMQHPVFVDGAAPTGPVTVVVDPVR
jgi:putative lipoprotein